METNKSNNTLRIEGMQAFSENNYDGSITILTRFLMDHPDDKIALMTRGSAQMKLKRLDAAVKDFSRVLQSEPANSRALHLRGLVYEQQGRDELALEDLNKAIENDPEYGAAYLSRSHVLAKMGRDEHAVEDRQMVVHLTSRNIEEYANENNVWHSNHMQVESMMETELNR